MITRREFLKTSAKAGLIGLAGLTVSGSKLWDSIIRMFGPGIGAEDLDKLAEEMEKKHEEIRESAEEYTETEKNSSSSKGFGLEEYFLQGEELKYLKLMTHYSNPYMEIYGNPYITKEKKELNDIINGGGVNINTISLLSFGEASYKMYNYNGYSSTKLLVPLLSIRFLELDSKKSLLEFLEGNPYFSESKGGLSLKRTTKKGIYYSISTHEGNYFFSKNNIFINVDIPWMNWDEEEFFPEEKIASINALLHYDKRINAKLITEYEDYRKGFRKELEEERKLLKNQ